MTKPLTAGIDPGKSGYACLIGDLVRDPEEALLDISITLLPPHFWPACVDADGNYILWKMWELCRRWYEMNVRLVVIEKQAPRLHGSGKLGAGREGTVSSWTNGFGYGAWRMALAAAGFTEGHNIQGVNEVVEVSPVTWKSSMGALASHSGVDSHAARRKSANEATLRVAQRLAPEVDFRPLERTPGARVPSPDKAVSFLLARYGQWVLDEKEKKR